MNARAASRLESLGFSRVYRYAAGKADWSAAGLPTERTDGETVRAGDVARRDVPTCAVDETVADARSRVEQGGFDVCPVVNDDRVVLGRVTADGLGHVSGKRVGDVMDVGPVTTRANSDVRALTARLRKRDVKSILVTDPDGRLIGLLGRDEAEAALQKSAGRANAAANGGPSAAE